MITIRTGGLLEFRSPDLHEGDQAEVTVVVVPRGTHENESNGAALDNKHEASANSQLQSLAAECSIPNWDGLGAVPVTQPTVLQASSFLAALPGDVPEPSIGAEPDGDVTLEWYCSPRQTLSVSVTSTGDLHYAALLGASKAYGTEQFSGTVPQIILDLIQRVELPNNPNHAHIIG